jgi:hypothetical protein
MIFYRNTYRTSFQELTSVKPEIRLHNIKNTELKIVQAEHGRVPEYLCKSISRYILYPFLTDSINTVNYGDQRRDLDGTVVNCGVPENVGASQSHEIVKQGPDSRGTRTKNGCAGEDQQQFTRLAD